MSTKRLRLIKNLVIKNLEFPSNQLAARIFGEHDQNLSRIEQKLGLACKSKGNFVSLTGSRQQIETGERVFKFLIEKSSRGGAVDFSLVDTAVRMLEKIDISICQEQEETETACNPIEEKEKRNPDQAVSDEIEIKSGTRHKIIGPRSSGQKSYIAALQKHDITFGLGPSGTGKTYLSVARAASMLFKSEVKRLILARPAVEAGEKLGFLPGDLKDKIDPYLRPLYDALNDIVEAGQLAKRLEKGQIEVVPIAFMRGRTLSNSFVIIDEAQNTTPVQMKMLLTRLGEGSKMAINGDPGQIDLPKGQKSGLLDAVQKLEGIQGVAVVTMTQKDVVRHELVARIISAYEKPCG